MSSQNDNNHHPTQSQGVALLPPEIKESLSRMLDAKIASLKAELKEVNASNAAFEEDEKIRYKKLKETRNEIKESKKRCEELKKTRDDLQRVGQHLADYVRLKRSNLKLYKAETMEIEKRHKESIEDMENKWKIYKAQCETLPLAVIRTNEEIALKKSKIELMVQQYKLAERKKIFAQRKAIEQKQINNLVVEMAGHWKTAQLQDIRMAKLQADNKNLLEIIAEQEKTLAEQERRKREKKSQVPDNNLPSKLEPNRKFIDSIKKKPQKLIRFDLSSFEEPTNPINTQPPPVFCRDNYDTMSITSSVIDDLIERGCNNPQQMENEENQLEENQGQENDEGDQQTSETAAAAFLVDSNENDKNLNVEEAFPLPSMDRNNPKGILHVNFEAMEIENEEVEESGELENRFIEIASGTAEQQIEIQKPQQRLNPYTEIIEEIEFREPGSNFVNRKLGKDELQWEEKREKERKGKTAGWEYPSTSQSGVLYPMGKSSGISYFPESSSFNSLKQQQEQRKDLREFRETAQTQMQINKRTPTITNIENVNVRLLQNRVPMTIIDGQDKELDPSVGKHFTPSAASGINYNWKTNLRESLNISFTESQRGNPDLESLLGSEVSLQSEDMMKKYHFSYSPEFPRDREDNHANSELENNENKNENDNNQNQNQNQSQNRRNKRDSSFFLNMF